MVNTSLKIILTLFIVSVLGIYVSFEKLESLWIKRIRHTFHAMNYDLGWESSAITVTGVTPEVISGTKLGERRAVTSQSAIGRTSQIEHMTGLRREESVVRVTEVTPEVISSTKPGERRVNKSQSAIGRTSVGTTSFLTEYASTGHISPPRRLKQVKHFKTDILLYSAIVGNSTENKTWDIIAITGWEALSLFNQDYMCCVLYSSGSVKIFPVIFKWKRYEAEMRARQYICALNESHLDDTPVAATLTESNNSGCHKEFSEYVDVEYSYRYPEAIVVFAKIIFGNISARDLIVWFEIHKLQGFEKVLMYPYKLNRDAMKVLEYYQRQGIAEVVPFAKPGLEHGKKETAMGTKNKQGWSDKCVALNDGLERLRGYKYIISLDIDEYLIPKNKQSWRSLFDSLFLSKPTAAGFRFQTYLYIKSWDPTNESSPFEVGRYSNRSDITNDRAKHVSVPARLKYGGFSTHHIVPSAGYNLYTARADEVAIHHFRSCRTAWLKPTTSFPCFNITRHHDETVLKLLRKVEKNVTRIINDIGI